MSEPVTEPIEEEKSDFVLTNELRERALKKPVFNILHVTDDDSKLSIFRGNNAFKNFMHFFDRQADISYITSTSSMFAKMDVKSLELYNILWIDNVSNIEAASNLANIHRKLLDQVEEGWEDKILSMDKKGMDYFRNLNNTRANNKLRIIYALDEFIWEGPVGRAHTIQTVKVMEGMMDLSDVIVTPTATLRESIQHYGFITDPNHQFAVIPTTIGLEFLPLQKEFKRNNRTASQSMMTKPKILIKGVTIPRNVQDFIVENYKKMDIVISSVGELDPHIIGLNEQRKISQIYHWANPHVNKRNMEMTYAIERDGNYDFVIHCKPDNIMGELYEVTSDVDDILLTIGSGAIPISGIGHIGYDTRHIGYSGIVFDKDTTSKKLRSIIETHMLPVKWNEAFTKARNALENYLITSPNILRMYFMIMLGRELTLARDAVAKEAADKLDKVIKKENKPNHDNKLNTPDDVSGELNDNVISGDFSKEENVSNESLDISDESQDNIIVGNFSKGNNDDV